MLLNVIDLAALLKPQLSEAYTLSDPLVHPGRKLTVIFVEADVNVVPPPFMVAFPVTVQV